MQESEQHSWHVPTVTGDDLGNGFAQLVHVDIQVYQSQQYSFDLIKPLYLCNTKLLLLGVVALFCMNSDVTLTLRLDARNSREEENLPKKKKSQTFFRI